MRRHPFGESLVLRSHDAAGEIAIHGLVPPEAVDRQRLHVDTLLVHQGDALRSQCLVSAAGLLLEWRSFDHVPDINDAVAMDVDDLDTSPADRDLTAGLSVQWIEAAGNGHRTGRAGNSPEEVSSIGRLHLRTPAMRGTLLQRNGGVKHN